MAIPVAQPLNVSGDEDTFILTTFSATDVDSDPVDFYEIVDQPLNGIVEPVSDGGIEEFVYRPGANFNGTDSFTYRAFAGGEYSDPVTVDITINAIEDAPVVAENLGPVSIDFDTTSLFSSSTAITGLAGGGYVVVGNGYNQAGDSDEGIQFQIFDVNNNPVTGEILANTTTFDPQLAPSVARMNDGSFVVSWTNINSSLEDIDIYMQRFSAAGAMLGGERLVNSTNGNLEDNSDLIAMGDGGLLAVWDSYDGLNTHVYMQRYDDGLSTVGGEVQVDTALGFDAYDPSAARLNDGSFVVAFTSPNLDGDGEGVFAQMFAPNGTPLLNMQVNAGSAGGQAEAEVAALASGGFVIGYMEFGAGTALKLQMFTASGGYNGMAISVPTSGYVANYSVTALADGGFAVAWEAQDTGPSQVFLQRFDTFGHAVHGPLVINAASPDNQWSPSLALLANGELALAWSEFAGGASEEVRTENFVLPTKNTNATEGLFISGLLPQAQVFDVDTGVISSMTVTVTGGARPGDFMLINPGEGTSLIATYGTDSVTVSGDADGATYSVVLQSLQLLLRDGGPGSLRTVQVEVTAGGVISNPMTFDVAVQTANQTITGVAVDESLYGGNGFDILEGGDGFDHLFGNGSNDSLGGGNNRDYLYGGYGDDTLNGGSGIDTMEGGDGDDTYYVNNSSESVIELEGGGMDVVFTGVDFTLLGGDIEDMKLTGSDNLAGTGNYLDNRIEGNSGNNYISGGSGYDLLLGLSGDDTLDGGFDIDTLVGSDGNDVYIVDGGDLILETAIGGVDRVESDGFWKLTAYLEDLTLTGTGDHRGIGNGLDNVITGNTGNNSLSGLDGADTLNGGDGNDTLNAGYGEDVVIGGAGDDTYIVIDGSDIYIENAGEGIDTVRSHTFFTLADNFENLVLLGNTTLNGSGNEGDNLIIGNAYSNSLHGLGGNDTLKGMGSGDFLFGGGGSDTYYVDAGDVVIEDEAPGIDTIKASITMSIDIYVENFVMQGSGAIDGYGNNGANRISGNTGNNYLSGNADNDTLNGNGGDDSIDGGDHNDVLTGGIGNDSINGGNDNDWLYGGNGSDQLTGGAGADIFVFNTVADGSAIDDITDFATGLDQLRLDDAIFSAVAAGTLSSASLAYGTAAVDADDFFIYDNTTGVLLYDADADGGGAAVQFALLSDIASLSATDILIV